MFLRPVYSLDNRAQTEQKVDLRAFQPQVWPNPPPPSLSPHPHPEERQSDKNVMWRCKFDKAAIQNQKQQPCVKTVPKNTLCQNWQRISWT